VFHLIDEDEQSLKSIYEFIQLNLAQLAKEQFASRVVETAILTMPCN
jgi:hypothetical protein